MRDIDIVLASGSPRRRDLLKGLGWRFRVVVPQVDETPRLGESPVRLCSRLSAEKAASVQNLRVDALVIAADTIVVVDGEILGKPSDKKESMEMLRRLQGRSHEVLTGIGLFWKGSMVSDVERTVVHFRALDDAAVAAYAETGEGMDKAGAYAIQGKGALLVSSIEGDYFNVVGLPLCKLGSVLEEMGLDLPRQWS